MGLNVSDSDLRSEFDQLKRRMAELERKTFSNLSVTDPLTGVKMLQIDEDAANGNAARIQIRDQAGAILIGNDTVSGWGFAWPIISYPMYPYSAFKLSTTLGVLDGLWNGGVNVLSRKVGWSFWIEGSGTVTSVEWRFSWLSNNTPDTTITQQTTSGLPTLVAGNYLLPSNQINKGVVFTVQARVAAGSGSAACTPYYVQTRGQAV
jgi:hypothetical protein